MNAQTPQKFTLEEIAERKKKLLNEIHAQKKAMTATTREIFAPLAPATNKADAIMRSFNTGMAVPLNSEAEKALENSDKNAYLGLTLG